MSDLDRRLREAGRRPVPPPDPAFATRLEERLRAGVPAPEPALRPASGPTGRRWLPATAVAAAVLTVVGLAVAVRSGGEREVRVASATDAVVVLPDGTVGPATPGLVIPDGSRLQTGNDGHVVAGDTELGPKQEARVDEGRVRPSPTTAPPASPAEPSTPTPTAPTATTAPPAAPSTTVTTTTPTPSTRPPAVTPTTTTKPTTRPVDTRPATTSTSGPAARVASLKLDARYRETAVKLVWSAYPGADFAAYLVLRADAPAEPRYPVDDATTVVARITDPSATTFTERIAGPAGRAYRVVAVDRDRRLIAASPAVRPQPAA